VQKQTMGEVEN